jgi:hypothetical protein
VKTNTQLRLAMHERWLKEAKDVLAVAQRRVESETDTIRILKEIIERDPEDKGL